MPSTTWMNVQCILLSERSLDSKDNIRIHDSMYMTFWKRQTRGIKKPSGGIDCKGNILRHMENLQYPHDGVA